MPIATFSSFRYRVYSGGAASGEQPDQVLEVRLRHFSRQIAGFPPAELVHEILDGNAPTPVPTKKIVFPLPLHDDPVFFQIYVVQLLSSLNLRAAACEVITEKITSYSTETAGGDRERKLQLVADVDHFELSWMEEKEGVEEGTAAAMEEKVRNENGEELGDCSICLEELSYWEEKKEVIESPCGHVYHESCIFKWLINDSSCPLCRCPLPLVD